MKKTSTFAALAFSIFWAGAASSETLTFAHGFPPTHNNVTQGAVPWMECVEKATAGKIDFKHFPSGQISGHKDSIHSLETGLAQISAIVPTYEGGKMPLNTMTNLPNMGTTSVEINAAYREMLDNGSPLAEEWTQVGVTPLMSMGLPAYQLMSTGAPIDMLEKFKGIKLRVSPGPQSMTADALNAVPVTIPSGDTFVALQRGTVDAAILALGASVAYGWPEVVKSVSSNGAFALGHTVLGIETKTFKGLPEEHQKAITECGLSVEKDYAANLDVLNDKAKKVYIDKGAVVYEFSEEELARMNERMSVVADQFVEDLEKRGVPARKTYDLYRTALDR